MWFGRSSGVLLRKHLNLHEITMERSENFSPGLELMSGMDAAKKFWSYPSGKEKKGCSGHARQSDQVAGRRDENFRRIASVF